MESESIMFAPPGSTIIKENKLSLLNYHSLREKILMMKYTKEQSKSTVSIIIEINDVHHHPREFIKVEFQPRSLEALVEDIDKSDYSFKVSQLAHEVDVKKSKFVISKDRLVLILHKLKPQHWESIYYNHPKVIENFKKKFIAALPPGIDKEHTFRNARHQAEIFCDMDIDILNPGPLLGNLIPASCRTVDQIEDYLKMELERGSRANSVGNILAIVLLMKERQIHSTFPEEMRTYSERSFGRYVTPKTKNDGSASEEKRKASELKEAGNAHFRAKRFHQAIEEYTRAIDLDPFCPTYYMNRSIVLYHLDRFLDSVEDADKAVSLDPSYVKALLYMAKNFIALTLPDKALLVLTELADIDSTNKAADIERQTAKDMKFNIDMFIAAYKEGDATTSNRYLDLISQTSKTTIQVFRILFRELCKSGDLNKAKEVAVAFASKPGGQVESYYYLGLCAYYEDDEEEVHRNFAMSSCLSASESSWTEEREAIRGVYVLRKKGDEHFSSGRYEEACEAYLQGLRLDDSSASVSTKFYFKIATIRFQQKKVGDAIRYLSLAVAKKSFHEALALRGKCYRSKEKYGKAIEDFECALQLHPCQEYEEALAEAQKKRDIHENSKQAVRRDKPKTKDQNYSVALNKERANKYLKSKRYNDALKAYTEVIKVDERDSESYCNRSFCHMMLKSYREALKDAESAVKADSSNVQALTQLGKSHIALGNSEEAVNILEKGLRLKPKDKSVFMELQKARNLDNAIKEGNSSMAKMNYSIASEYFLLAIGLAVNCVPLYLKRSECFIHLREFEKASFIAESVMCSGQCIDDVYYFIGLSAYYKGERNEAIKSLEMSLSANPTHSKALEAIEKVKTIYYKREMGNRAFSENRLEDALSIYLEGLRIDSSNFMLNAIFHFSIGEVHITRKEWEEAAHSFTSAIALKKDYAEAYLKRAECYLETNELRKGVDDYEQLNRISPCPKHTKLLEQTKEKLAAYTQFVSTEKRLQIALAHRKNERGDKCFEEGKLEEAFEAYSEAVSLDPACHLYYARRCACQIVRKRYSNALNDALKIIDIDSQFAIGYLLLGKCHNAFGKADEAIAAFEKAKELDLTSDDLGDEISKAFRLQECLQEGTNSYKRKRYRKAHEKLEIASKIASANASILFKRAKCLLRLQRPKELFDLIGNCTAPELERAPEFLCLKGINAYYQDKKDEALKNLKAALDSDPLNPEVKDWINRVRKVYTLHEKGKEAFLKQDFSEALNYYKEALKIEPHNRLVQAKLQFDLGVLQMEQKSLSDAIASFTSAINLKEDFLVKALEKRGQCNQETKDYEEAVRDFELLYNLTFSEVHLKLWMEAKRQLVRVTGQKYMERIKEVSLTGRNMQHSFSKGRLHYKLPHKTRSGFDHTLPNQLKKN